MIEGMTMYTVKDHAMFICVHTHVHHESVCPTKTNTIIIQVHIVFKVVPCVEFVI